MSEPPADWGEDPPAPPQRRTTAKVPGSLGRSLHQTREALDAIAEAETPEEAARRLDAALVTLKNAQAQLPRAASATPPTAGQPKAARSRRRHRPNRRHRTESRIGGMFRRNKGFRALVILLVVAVLAVAGGMIAGGVRWGSGPPPDPVVPESGYAPAELLTEPHVRNL